MVAHVELNRRGFLRVSFAAAGGLVVSLYLDRTSSAQEVPMPRQPAKVYPPDAFVNIRPDGKIVIQVNRLEFGHFKSGFMGVNEKLFAIPWKSLDLSREHHYVLNVPKDELKNAPGFDKHSWPNMADMRWGTGVHTFYGQKPYWDDQEDFDRDSRLTGIEDENE